MFYVTTFINGRVIRSRQPVDDPYIYTTVWISRFDRLKSLFKRNLVIEVVVDSDAGIIAFQDLMNMVNNHD